MSPFLFILRNSVHFGAAVLDEICDALSALEIEVEQLHPESAPGQFEIVTRYSEALEVIFDSSHGAECICISLVYIYPLGLQHVMLFLSLRSLRRECVLVIHKCITD